MSRLSERGRINGVSKSKAQLAAHREKIRVFLAAVQAGASDRSAAAEAGISMESLHRWKHGDRPFDVAMRRQLYRARSIRERRWLTMIETAANGTTVPTAAGGTRGVPGDWRAAAWLMERTNPEFAPQSTTRVEGGSSPVRVEHDVEHRLATPDPERLAMVAALLQRAGAMPLLETKETNGNGNGHADEG